MSRPPATSVGLGQHALVVKRALADPSDHGLYLRGREVPALRHGTHATVGSGQGLREQAKRRVVRSNEEPSIAASRRRTIDDSIVVPRRMADLARATGENGGNVLGVGDLRGIGVAQGIHSGRIRISGGWRVHAKQRVARRQANHNAARIRIRALCVLTAIRPARCEKNKQGQKRSRRSLHSRSRCFHTAKTMCKPSW